MTTTSRRKPYKPWVPTSQVLTERELQILQGMSDGLSNPEIGRQLYIAEDTVKTHARRLFMRIKANGRDHAVRVGFERKLLIPESRPATVKLGGHHLRLLELISMGLTYPRIAVRLGIGMEYAKSSAQPMFRELDARNRAHAVRRGFEHGLLKGPTEAQKALKAWVSAVTS